MISWTLNSLNGANRKKTGQPPHQICPSDVGIFAAWLIRASDLRLHARFDEGPEFPNCATHVVHLASGSVNTAANRKRTGRQAIEQFARRFTTRCRNYACLTRNRLDVSFRILFLFSRRLGPSAEFRQIRIFCRVGAFRGRTIRRKNEKQLVHPVSCLAQAIFVNERIVLMYFYAHSARSWAASICGRVCEPME